MEESLHPTAYAKFKKTVLALEEDAEKAYKGNKAAGTRLRNGMQAVKGLAQECRQEMMSVRNNLDLTKE